MTNIEWTQPPGFKGETWNPTTGCTKTSAGCTNCYAEGVAERFWAKQYPPVESERIPIIGATVDDLTRPRRFTDVQCHPERLEQPLRWRKRRFVFVDSMSDLFHEEVPDEFIRAVFIVMGRARRHRFAVLTKRPERMECLFRRWMRDGLTLREGYTLRTDDKCRPLPNVILGVSAEDQATADERIPLLLQTPAALRMVSYEPAIGGVDVRPWLRCQSCGYSRDDQKTHGDHGRCDASVSGAPWGGLVTLDWVVCGGESGPNARPCHMEWLRSVKDQCQAAGVPCFIKQLGAVPYINDCQARTWTPDDRGRGRVTWPKSRKGNDPAEWPEDLRVREWPKL